MKSEKKKPLEKEFDYYIANQSKLVKKFKGRVLVIVGKAVVGNYGSVQDAYFESLKKYKPGSFLIQKCYPGKDNYTQTFHSPRVVFYRLDNN
jgi:hypothetical protein